MAISVRSPKGRFGGLFGGGSSSSSGSRSGSGSSGWGSSSPESDSSSSGSGSNQDSSSERGGSRYPQPDPGAFGGISDEDDLATSSGRNTSYTGSRSSGNSTAGGASRGESTKSTESGNGLGSVSVSTGAIIGIVAGAVGFIFLMSCAHYWSRGTSATPYTPRAFMALFFEGQPLTGRR